MKKKLWLKIILLLLAVGLLYVLAVNIAYLVHEKNAHAEYETIDLNRAGTVKDIVIYEDDYGKEMEEKVEPFLEEYEKTGYFYSFDDKEIYYRTYKLDDPKASIVISHGFCENSEKYLETAYYFLNEGYSVYIMDHRGLGYSWREDPNFSKVYIDDFETYVKDFSNFVENVVIPESDGTDLYLFAHSMGGGIGARVLEEHPEYFKKAVLTSPMMDPVCAGLTKPLAEAFANTCVRFGKAHDYVIGHYDFDYIEDFDLVACGNITRYHYFFSKIVENEYLQSYGATYSWLKACLDGTDVLMERENLEKIDIPVLIFMAGNDNLVRPVGIYDFKNNVPTSRIVYIPDVKHELYTGSSELLVPYHAYIEEFYNE